MSVALHAQRILHAWDRFNFVRFEAELDSALMACKNPTFSSSELESEERAVLESAVQQLRTVRMAYDDNAPFRLEAGFLLLRHLQGR